MSIKFALRVRSSWMRVNFGLRLISLLCEHIYLWSELMVIRPCLIMIERMPGILFLKRWSKFWGFCTCAFRFRQNSSINWRSSAVPRANDLDHQTQRDLKKRNWIRRHFWIILLKIFIWKRSLIEVLIRVPIKKSNLDSKISPRL